MATMIVEAGVIPPFLALPEALPCIPSPRPEAATARPRQHFMGVDIELAPNVLSPRAETEILGLSAIRILVDRGPGQFVIDMCCGSGNLACAVAARLEDTRIWASDLTEDAVDAARRNAGRLGFTPRVTIAQGDLFAGLDCEQLLGKIDLVMCNPPYISSGRLSRESAHLLDHEPREAFDGGPYGVSIQQRLIREAPRFLRPGGWLAFEFGCGQERQVTGLLKRNRGYGVPQFVCDAAGLPRVVLTQKAE
jgi:release factor glutamine methyltransferase